MSCPPEASSFAPLPSRVTNACSDARSTRKPLNGPDPFIQRSDGRKLRFSIKR